jgi:hypothetical protein
VAGGTEQFRRLRGALVGHADDDDRAPTCGDRVRSAGELAQRQVAGARDVSERSGEFVRTTDVEYRERRPRVEPALQFGSGDPPRSAASQSPDQALQEDDEREQRQAEHAMAQRPAVPRRSLATGVAEPRICRRPRGHHTNVAIA